MEAIRAAGLRLIFEHGYESMSLRRLAAEVGIQVGSLYNHISTKQALLFDLIDVHMRALLAELEKALHGIDAPDDRLRAFVAFHVSYHILRKREVFISYSELRSLEPDNRAAIVALRKRYEQKLTDILVAGRERGRFRVADPRVTTFVIIWMLTGICEWYQPGGRMSEDELVAVHTDMVLGAVDAN